MRMVSTSGRPAFTAGRLLADMRPSLTQNYSADARLVDAEFFCEPNLFPAGFVQISYPPHLRIVEDGPAVAAAGNIEQSGAAGVQHVVGVLDVLKVAGVIVGLVAVLVVHAVIVLATAYLSRRGAEKCPCHKRMDVDPGRVAILVDGYARVSTAVRLGEKDSAFHPKRLAIAASDCARKGFNSAMTRNFVKPLEAGDRFPCFAHASNYTAGWPIRRSWQAI